MNGNCESNINITNGNGIYHIKYTPQIRVYTNSLISISQSHDFSMAVYDATNSHGLK